MDDRLSELPEPILHHILCLLSQKDAVKTCVLSKSWRHLGITLPKVKFDSLWFRSGQKETYLSFVDKTLQRYHDLNISIHELVLSMGPSQTLFLEKWILLAKGLKIFNVCLFCKSAGNLNTIFQAQSLQELYLESCNLKENNNSILFKRLRTLSLKKVLIAEETLNKIFSSCPLIEFVVLDQCEGFTTIRVNEAPNLKRFECCIYTTVFKTGDHIIIKIDAKTVETIRISDYHNWYQRHDDYFLRLKTLFLERVRLCRKSFDVFSSNFPCLEELNIDSCYGFEEFHLSSPSIKRLTIRDLGDSVKVDIIDAPNMLLFKFYGFSLPSSISFTTTSSNELESRLQVNCFLDSDNDDCSTWFLKLNEVLKALSQSQLIALFLYCSERAYQIIGDTFGYSYNKPVEVELMFVSHSLSPYLPASLNLFFRTFRPRYIVDMHLYTDAKLIFQIENNKQVDSLCNIFLNKRETMSELYFWLQDLKEVSMDIFDENAKKWRIVRGESLSECALPNNQYKQEIRFRLKWRELS